MEITVYQLNISIFHKSLDLLISSIINNIIMYLKYASTNSILRDMKLKCTATISLSRDTNLNCTQKISFSICAATNSVHRDADLK